MPMSGSSRELYEPSAVRYLPARCGHWSSVTASRRVLGSGVRVSVRQGPVIQFGAPTRLAAKWAAATRVLADHGSGGARFIDVRLPERPAAGQTAPGSASTQSGASATTAQAGAATAPDATATNTQP